jgi:hypothetical protein
METQPPFWDAGNVIERGLIELTTNKAVEDAAIAFVHDYQRSAGPSAHDTGGKGEAADKTDSDYTPGLLGSTPTQREQR